MSRNDRRLVAKGIGKALDAHPCGPCRECCTVMGVSEIGKAQGEPCPKMRVAPNTGPIAGGCSVYKTRPASCAEYNCIFRLGLLDKIAGFATGDAGRPDKLGLFFDLNETKATGIQMITVREIREGAMESNMELLHTLAGQGHVLYLIDGERRRMMGPEERVRAVQLAAKRSLPLVSR